MGSSQVGRYRPVLSKYLRSKYQGNKFRGRSGTSAVVDLSLTDVLRITKLP